MSETKRETLGSRLGFLLLSAGCAIGLGNVWRFPWVVGKNGGAIFVLFYLAFLALLGLPVLTMEFALGRASRKSPLHMYGALAPEKKAWSWHGPVCLAGNYLLMMFYTIVCGWMVLYFEKFATGTISGLDPAGVDAAFDGMLADPVTLCTATALVVVLAFFILSMGLQGGVERVTKGMMLLLLFMMAVMAVHNCFLEGGGKGLAFYLKPDVDRFLNAKGGPVRVCAEAMNQAFFTLSLGIGSMAIFGSYVGRDRTLLGESATVACLDTFVAIVAGLIIFPACSAFLAGGTTLAELRASGQAEAVFSGPGLIFKTLPKVFNPMPGGRIWGTLFFVFMTFAAFSTVLAVCENILAMTMDRHGWTRQKACAACCGLVFVLSLPCALGFNLLSGFHPLGGGSNVLDLEDFIVSNLLLPIGALLFTLFCCHRFGWGWDNFVAEANTGRGPKIRPWMRFYCAWIVPAIVLGILLLGLWDKFGPKR
jgi:NSS family neurotransmitter:Na+ symporter